MSGLKKRFNHFVKWLLGTKTSRIQTNGIGIKSMELNGVNDLLKQQILQTADNLERKIMQNIQDKYNRQVQDLQSLESLIAYRKLVNYLNDKENNCSVCLKSIYESYNLAITKCGHIFCYSCFLEWGEKCPKNDIDFTKYKDQENDVFYCKCPYCRRPLKLHEVFEMSFIIKLMALDKVIKERYSSKNGM